MGGREHEYNRDQSPHDAENKPQSGELAKGEERKLPFRGAQKKSPFLEALVEMNKQHIQNQIFKQYHDALRKAIERNPNMSMGQFTETLKLLDDVFRDFGKTEEREETDKDTPTKYDLNSPPEPKTDDPPNLPDNYEPKPTPLFESIKNEKLYRATAGLLWQENEQLRAENERLSREPSDRVMKSREKHPEKYRKYQRDYMREYRTRKKLESESQKPPEEQDDSNQSS